MGIETHVYYPSPDEGSGEGLKLEVILRWNSNNDWEATWRIVDPGTGYHIGERITVDRPTGGSVPAAVFPNGSSFDITKIDISEDPEEENTDDTQPWVLRDNVNAYDAVADYVQFPGMETKSHQDGPEHEVVYVNELIDPGENKALYTDLAIGGIRINSSKEWTNFTQLSAYFKKGIKVPILASSEPWDSTRTYQTGFQFLGRRVFHKGKSYKSKNAPHTNKEPGKEPDYWEENKKASNNFVEIAYALLTDSNLGAGELIGVNSIGDMTDAAKFVKANGFTWDGVISNKINLREFLHQQGSYNLLDFTVVGGKFNLVPTVPYKKDDHTIDHKADIGKEYVKAMFTDGNIKDLKVSFLSPEEKQPFMANVLYREEEKNGFAETKNCMLRLIGPEDAEESPPSDHWFKGGSSKDPIETYDLSGFCTTREAAEKYAKYILKVRKEVDHGLSLKTAPQYVANLQPGDYFRLVSEATHTARYDNGVITKDGDVISKDVITGSKEIYWWEPGTVGVKEATVNFDEKPTLPTEDSTKGVLFTLKSSITANRVYKLETIAYAEDGLIEVSGSHAPLTETGSLAILDGWDGTMPFKHFKEVF